MSRQVKVWHLDVTPRVMTPTADQEQAWFESCVDYYGDEYAGHHSPFAYPTPRRKNLLSKAAAIRNAEWLRKWGYTVRIGVGEITEWDYEGSSDEA